LTNPPLTTADNFDGGSVEDVKWQAAWPRAAPRIDLISPTLPEK
jgi:hypothetical protein